MCFFTANYALPIRSILDLTSTAQFIFVVHRHAFSEYSISNFNTQ